MCPNASKDVTKAVELFGGRFTHLTYAASALVSGEAGLAVLRMTIFKDIETSINDLPLKDRTVLIIVVQNIVQSPTKMITIDNYYNTLSSPKMI